MEYLEVEQAIARPGLRLVLSAGVPGPWGEGAKALFAVKRIDYTPVRQVAAAENEALRRWTGQSNAPIAVQGDEPARSGWAEILSLAERLAPEPALVPARQDERVRMFGLLHELCGERGFGWQRRLMIVHALESQAAAGKLPAVAREGWRRIGERYGYDAAAGRAAPARVAETLALLSAELRAQRARGCEYFVGERLSALDLYWAAFAVLVSPYPDELCPLHPSMRQSYELRDPQVRAAADPILLEHRDLIYRKHLSLPLDF